MFGMIADILFDRFVFLQIKDTLLLDSYQKETLNFGLQLFLSHISIPESLGIM
jgi:hypothetical protein